MSGFKLEGPHPLQPLSLATLKIFFSGAEPRDRSGRAAQYALRALNGYYAKLVHASPPPSLHVRRSVMCKRAAKTLRAENARGLTTLCTAACDPVVRC